MILSSLFDKSKVIKNTTERDRSATRTGTARKRFIFFIVRMSAADKYRIEPGHGGFRAIELLPNGRDGSAFCGFPSENAARRWIENCLEIWNNLPSVNGSLASGR